MDFKIALGLPARIKKFSLSIRHDKSRRTLAELCLTDNPAVCVLPLSLDRSPVPYARPGGGAFWADRICSGFHGIFWDAGGLWLWILRDAPSGSRARRPSEAASNLFRGSMGKDLLAAISFALMIGFVELLPSRRSEFWLYMACYTAVIGSVVAPEWFFIGIEKMKFITILGLVSRSVATILVFSVVHRASDYMWVPFLNGTGGIAGACVGHWRIQKEYGIRIARPNFRGIAGQLREGWDNFLSSVFISLYTTTNAFVLGLMTNATQVGYYSAAERVSSGIGSLWGPVPQVLFPRFARLFAEDRERGKRQLRIVLIFTAFATLLLSIAGCLVAPFLIRIYLGARFAPSIPIVQILVFNIFVVGVNTVLGAQGLIANKLNAAFRNIVLGSGLLNLALLFPAIRLYGVVGPAISVLIVESAIIVAETVVLRKEGLI